MGSQVKVSLVMNQLMYCSRPKNPLISFSLLGGGISNMAMILDESTSIPLSLTKNVTSQLLKNIYIYIYFMVRFLGPHVPHHTSHKYPPYSLIGQPSSSYCVSFLFSQHTHFSLKLPHSTTGFHSTSPSPPSFFRQDHWKNFVGTFVSSYLSFEVKTS